MKRTRLIDLGTASYMPVWRQQEELHNEIIAAKLRGEETGNCMIFVEHNHVYTLGKSGNEAKKAPPKVTSVVKVSSHLRPSEWTIRLRSSSVCPIR